MDWMSYSEALAQGYILDAGEAVNGVGVGWNDDVEVDDNDD